MRGGLIFLSTLILSLAAGLGGYSLFNHWVGTPTGPGQQSAASSQTTVIGSQRPDFTLLDINNQRHSISEWDGQVVLINFWATWCPPCRREIPTLADLHRKLGPKGFTVIGAAMDSPEKVQSFVTKFSVPYPNLIGQRQISLISRQLGNHSESLPYTAIIGRDGRVAYTHLGEIERRTALDQILPLLQENTDNRGAADTKGS
jgi:peroxiredoxin